MEFHQKPDAETGAQLHHVAPGAKQIADLSTDNLRKKVRSGDPQPALRSALGALDSLLTKCFHAGDYKFFAPYLAIEDATATRATLELIRRQTKALDAALIRAEAQLLEVRDSQTRPVAKLAEGEAE